MFFSNSFKDEDACLLMVRITVYSSLSLKSLAMSGSVSWLQGARPSLSQMAGSAPASISCVTRAGWPQEAA